MGLALGRALGEHGGDLLVGAHPVGVAEQTVKRGSLSTPLASAAPPMLHRMHRQIIARFDLDQSTETIGA